MFKSKSFKRSLIAFFAVGIGAVAVAIASSTTEVQAGYANQDATYSNVIKNGGQDPWVVQAGGFYYYCEQRNNNSVVLIKTARLEDVASGSVTTIYTCPPGTMHSTSLWAPEIHYVNGRWYVYFAADNGVNANHRMYVVQGGTNANNPLDGGYSFVGKVTDWTDRWAIDGTIFKYAGQLYFVWSGWEGYDNVKQSIYIARMSSPTQISGDRVQISTPNQWWELNGFPSINEGPQILIKNNSVHIIYSASGSWTDDYCLGRLTCTNGNFLNPGSWTKVGPVFAKTNNVFGPGHCCFVKSPDGTEDIIVYHAARSAGSGWDRNIRMQRFTWHGDTPFFGKPIETGVNLANPSTDGEFPLVSGRKYKVVNVATGKCLDVPSAADANNTQLWTYADNGTNAQQWTFNAKGGGYYTLTPACAPSRSLDVPAATTNVGAVMQMWSTNNHYAQQFSIQYVGNGQYRIISQASLLGLTDNGANVSQQIVTNNANQLWYIQEIFEENATYMIVNCNSNKALDLIGGDTSNGARINQWSIDYNSRNQYFTIKKTNSGTYNILHRDTKKAACIAGPSVDNWAQLHLWGISGNGGTDQQWRFIDLGDGTYNIQNVYSGKMLEIYYGGRENDNKVCQYADNNSLCQRWYIIKL